MAGCWLLVVGGLVLDYLRVSLEKAIFYGFEKLLVKAWRIAVCRNDDDGC